MGVVEKEKVLVPKLRFKGFKQEWVVSTIANVSNKITDGTHDTPKKVNEGYPYLTAVHVKDGYIHYEDCYFLSKEAHEVIYKRCNPEYGDLLMVNIGAGTATAAMVIVDYEFSLKNVALIKPNRDILEPSFFAQYQRLKSKRLFHNLTSGGAQPFLALNGIGKLKIETPTLPEQQKIAAFLSSVDEKIQQLNRKKKLLDQYKKGVMQQLFSGKLRFKDENGNNYPDWKGNCLGDFYGNLKTGMTPRRIKPEYFKGEIPWITSGELNYNFIYDTKERISQDGQKDANLKLYPANTLFIAITGLEAPGTRGKCAINAVPSTTNQSCMAFEKKEGIDTFFLFQWYKHMGIRLFYRYAQGTKQQSFNNKLVQKFPFSLPCIKEQQKIANYLSNIDKKIEQVTQQITQTQTFKKGLLQQMFV